MMIFSLILAVVFSLVAVIFALGNAEPITVSFLKWQITQSGALVLLGAVALGIVIGLLLMTPGAIKRNLALASHKKKLKNTEKALNQHKAKLSELEEKVAANERAKEEVIAAVQKPSNEAVK